MMKLTIKDLEHGQPIPARNAFGIPDAKNHMAFGENLSPEISWSDAPAGTQSFVILVKDIDVPSVADDVNQDRKSTRLNSSHVKISYAVFCLKKKTNIYHQATITTHT